MTRTKAVLLGVGAVVLVAGGWFFLGTQRDDTSAVGTRAAPPPTVSAAPASSATLRFQVAQEGLATFLIDAPLEKAKGRSPALRGSLDIEPNDLTKSRGEVDVDLSVLKTETFDDKDKNEMQTEHAHNWMEIGSDVPAAQREQNRWVRFTIGSIDSATPSRLADAPEVSGSRTVKIVAAGNLWLHGVTSPKTVKLTATFSGPASAPTLVHVVSDEPMNVSMKEHDVKPRDVAGKFLMGGLERVGKKLDDKVQVSIDFSARPGGAVAGNQKP